MEFNRPRIMEATVPEMRAAEMVYEKEHGSATSFESIPADERETILKRIRARVLRIEEFVTHDMLVDKISEKRKIPRRHMRAALLSGAVGVVLIFVALLIVDGVKALFHW